MQQHKKKRLLIMAGGTGGHIFPALAVAKELQQANWEIFWIGTKDRMEAELVPKYGIPIEFIQISGLRGKGVKALLLSPFHILRAIVQARKIIKKIQPDVVLGMGGYVSGPTGVAAKLCGVPIVLHEQNAVAGLTNRWLARLARKVMQAFPTAFKQAEVVGNPVRDVFFQQAEPDARFQNRDGKLRLLIAGGSQGAKVLNDVLPEFATHLKGHITLRHQVGKGNVEKVLAHYKKNEFDDVMVSEFIDDMASAYGWADIVICRSGALTVCELSAVGASAIFVPFQHKDRQQYLNAMYLAKDKAGIIIEQKDFSTPRLLEEFSQLHREDCLKMAKIAKTKATPNSAKDVANAIIHVANNK